MSTVPATSANSPPSRLMDLWLEYWEREKGQRARVTPVPGGDDGLAVLKAMAGVMLGEDCLSGRLQAAQASSHQGLV